jgi:hypothetical protein
MTLSPEKAALRAVHDQKMDAVVQSSTSVSVQLCAAIMQGECAPASAEQIVNIVLFFPFLTVLWWLSVLSNCRKGCMAGGTAAAMSDCTADRPDQPGSNAAPCSRRCGSQYRLLQVRPLKRRAASVLPAHRRNPQQKTTPPAFTALLHMLHNSDLAADRHIWQATPSLRNLRRLQPLNICACAGQPVA